jgi:CheY-like chemotaxis protein
VNDPRPRVLVVDDDSRVRAALVGLLDSIDGIQVLAVDSAQADRLLDLLGHDSAVADLALVDVPARGHPGPLLARMAAAVPTVALSLGSGGRDAALSAGARAFVEKGDDALLTEVGALLAAGRDTGAAEEPCRDTGEEGLRHG